MQAAIADLHTQELRDWERIAHLYRRLEELTGSAVVTVKDQQTRTGAPTMEALGQ